MTLSRRILSTIDIKGSPAPPWVGARPDELMIDWTTLPRETTASLFLPSVNADEVIADAARMYGFQPFTRLDPNTVSCKAQGVTYMPIPVAPGNLAGFIDVQLPHTVRTGDHFSVTVSQITNAQSRITTSNNGPRLLSSGPSRSETVKWRKVAGTFQLASKINAAKDTVITVERNLSLLRWIFAAMPPSSRWYPIFLRYIGAVADQVSGLGRDPNTIPPSATGIWPGGSTDPGTTDRHEHTDFVGKIEGLVYDHFGDFEGFILESDNGKRWQFYSRHGHMEEIALRAWRDSLRVTVISEDHEEHRPKRVVLHATPRPL